MILQAGHDAALPGVVDTLTDVLGHPLQGLIEGVALAEVVTGEDTDLAGAQFDGDVDPSFGELDVLLPDARIRLGEVSSHTGTVDGHAVEKRLALQGVDVVIRRGVRIAREVVAGGVEARQVIRRAEIDDVGNRDLSRAQGRVEGVDVEAEGEVRPRVSFHLVASEPRRGESKAGESASGPQKELTSIRV